MSNYPDNVSPSDPHFQGPTPEELEAEERKERLRMYILAIGGAEEEIQDLTDTLTYLDGNFPDKDRHTIAKRGYSFFLLQGASGPMFLALAISSLKTSLRELREKVEDLT